MLILDEWLVDLGTTFEGGMAGQFVHARLLVGQTSARHPRKNQIFLSSCLSWTW